MMFYLKNKTNKIKEVNIVMVEISEEVDDLEKRKEATKRNIKCIEEKLKKNNLSLYDRLKYEFQLGCQRKGYAKIVRKLQCVEN
ncbi:MAG: hypothetical protein ABH831_02990 [Candidatus Nealsonbacteria bacterium]